jgi:hypothetical protein
MDSAKEISMDASHETMLQAASRLGVFTIKDIASHAGVDPSDAKSFIEMNQEWFDRIAAGSDNAKSRRECWRVKASRREALFDLVSDLPDTRSDPDDEMDHATSDMLRSILDETERRKTEPRVCRALLRRARAYLDTLQTELWDLEVTSDGRLRDEQTRCSELSERFAALWQVMGMSEHEPSDDESAKELRDALSDWSLSLPRVRASLPHRGRVVEDRAALRGEKLANALLHETNYSQSDDAYGILRPALLALSYKQEMSAVEWKELRVAMVRAIPPLLRMPQAGSQLAAIIILAVVFEADDLARDIFRVLIDPVALERVSPADWHCMLSGFARLAAVSAQSARANYVASACAFLIESECLETEVPTLLPAALCHDSPTQRPLLDRASAMFNADGLKPMFKGSVNERQFLRSVSTALFFNYTTGADAGDLITLLDLPNQSFLRSMCRAPTYAMELSDGEDEIYLRPGEAIRQILGEKHSEIRLSSDASQRTARNLLQIRIDESWREEDPPESFYGALGSKDFAAIGWGE